VPEIERKFLVEELPAEARSRLATRLRQGYLSVGTAEVRVRSRDDLTHRLTVKSAGGLTRTEVELPLTPEQFEELWPLVQSSVQKSRTLYEVDGRTAEIDVYAGKLDGLVVAEVEFPTEADAHAFTPPSWFGTEVTDDPRYRNSALAAAVAPPQSPAKGAPVVTTAAAPLIPADQLPELLGLLDQTDTVELKLTMPVSDRQPAGAALGVDPLDAQIRQVYFFDTPDLALNKAGLVVRARRVQRKGDDSVVKLRPIVPEELPSELRASPSFGVEVDAMPGGFVCSGSMKRSLGKKDVRRVVLGERPLRKLFSKEQRALYEAHAPDGLAIDELSILGPVFVLKLRFSPRGLARKLVAELWLYPDNSMILELSTKCLPAEAFDVAAETRSYLAEKGVDMSSDQETKTKKALEYFAASM
jgi:CYTH domain-containing protein